MENGGTTRYSFGNDNFVRKGEDRNGGLPTLAGCSCPRNNLEKFGGKGSAGLLLPEDVSETKRGRSALAPSLAPAPKGGEKGGGRCVGLESPGKEPGGLSCSPLLLSLAAAAQWLGGAAKARLPGFIIQSRLSVFPSHLRPISEALEARARHLNRCRHRHNPSTSQPAPAAAPRRIKFRAPASNPPACETPVTRPT